MVNLLDIRLVVHGLVCFIIPFVGDIMLLVGL